MKFLKGIERSACLLICDEWGYVAVISQAQSFFGIISDCCERKILIITTNLEFTKWNEIFVAKKLVDAAIDRIIVTVNSSISLKASV